jgi:hypothetical protein
MNSKSVCKARKALFSIVVCIKGPSIPRIRKTKREISKVIAGYK